MPKGLRLQGKRDSLAEALRLGANQPSAMAEEGSAFIVSARRIGPVRSAGFQTCRIADFQVGRAWNSTAGLILTAIRRFGNLRFDPCTWKSRGPSAGSMVL